MPTSPWASRRTTGRVMSSTRVRRWMPAASLSLDANPSLTHESWFPLMRTTGMRARENATSVSSSSLTASVGGTARS